MSPALPLGEHRNEGNRMRRTVLTVIGLALLGSLATATSAAADGRHCYSLGVPGQDHYTYCTYLPVEPDDLLHD